MKQRFPMADLYANENFPLATVQSLRRLGHNVLTSAEAGNPSQRIPDERMLAFATNGSRALVNHNRQDDFVGLSVRTMLTGAGTRAARR